MSRYLLLLILNIPFITAAILGAVTRYKIGHSSRQKLIVQLVLWIFVLIGLLSAEYTYTYLFDHNLTESEPLSLFDVVQITAIVTLFYMINQAKTRIETLEHRLHTLHRELSIRLSDTK